MVRMRVLTVGASLLLFGAACGQSTSREAGVGLEVGTDGPQAAVALALAVEQTATAGTGRFESTIEMGGMPGLGSVTMTVTGAYDLASGRSETRTDLGSAFGELFAGASDELPAEYAEMFTGEMVQITDGDVVYMQMPMLGLLFDVPAGAWLRVDPTAMGIDPEDLAGTGTPAPAQDPAALLDFLRGASEEGLVAIGPGEVRGVPTTRYEGTFTLRSALAEAAGDEGRAHIQELLADAPDGVVDQAVPFEVEVGDDGQVRRVTIDVGAIVAEDERGEVSMRVTTEFFAIGEPVEIALPPADQVVDLAEVMDRFGGALGEGWLNLGPLEAD